MLVVLLRWKNQACRCELERTKRLDGHLLRDLENSQNFIKIGGKILGLQKLCVDKFFVNGRTLDVVLQKMQVNGFFVTGRTSGVTQRNGKIWP